MQSHLSCALNDKCCLCLPTLCQSKWGVGAAIFNKVMHTVFHKLLSIDNFLTRFAPHLSTKTLFDKGH